MLLNKLLFDEFTPFRCPWDMDIEIDSVRPPALSESEVKLDAEFFRCKDPVFDVKLTGLVRVAFIEE